MAWHGEARHGPARHGEGSVRDIGKQGRSSRPITIAHGAARLG